jgi:hypothetical protein
MEGEANVPMPGRLPSGDPARVAPAKTKAKARRKLRIRILTVSGGLSSDAHPCARGVVTLCRFRSSASKSKMVSSVQRIVSSRRAHETLLGKTQSLQSCLSSTGPVLSFNGLSPAQMNQNPVPVDSLKARATLSAVARWDLLSTGTTSWAAEASMLATKARLKNLAARPLIVRLKLTAFPS